MKIVPFSLLLSLLLANSIFAAGPEKFSDKKINPVSGDCSGSELILMRDEGKVTGKFAHYYGACSSTLVDIEDVSFDRKSSRLVFGATEKLSDDAKPIYWSFEGVWKKKRVSGTLTQSDGKGNNSAMEGVTLIRETP